jgi:hypothetical protein
MDPRSTTFNSSDPILIGSQQTISSLSSMHEESIGGMVTCCSSSENEFAFKTTAGVNPCTGCEYPLTSSLNGTTAFHQDNLEKDLYHSESREVDRFYRMLDISNMGLSVEEIATAYAAYNLWELGHRIYVMVSRSEIGLINFCTSQHLKYSIID